MKVWIHIDGVQEGPFELDQLPLDRITPDTPVWYDGLPQWIRACDAPAVAQMLEADSTAPQASNESAAETESSLAIDQEPKTEIAQQVDAKPQQASYVPAATRQYAAAAVVAEKPAENDIIPNAYLVWSIITTLLCCTPISIAAIITWSVAKRKYRYDDIAGAQKYANATAWLIMISIVLTLAGMPFYLIITSI